VELKGISALVTGGSSGLGLATAKALVAVGARVMITDTSELAPENLTSFGDAVLFSCADVTDNAEMTAAFGLAEREHGPLRATVHCAGRGGDRKRILNADGEPSPLDSFEDVIRVNLVGTYNVLRLAASRIGRTEPIDGERGAIVLTASVAAFDGQIGQTSYTAAKAGVHGMTLVAARDLAAKKIRVNTIAPGVFDTAMLGRLPDEIRAKLSADVPHPKRLGNPSEFAAMALSLLSNGYANGVTVRLDGGIRMPPR
jgi:NAD(P)-dependent dehydrogenase (short-subunit alcohol dehydrogenase family)